MTEQELAEVVQLPIDVPLTVKTILPFGLPEPVTVAVSVTGVFITTGEADDVIVVVVGLEGAADVGAGIKVPLTIAMTASAANFFTIFLRYLASYIDNGRHLNAC